MKISNSDPTIITPSFSNPQAKAPQPPLSNDGGKFKEADATIRHSGETGVTAPLPERIYYNRVAEKNTKTHAVVQQIREVDQTMDSVAKSVQKMKDALEGITKSYPPFPPGSKERAAALRQFGGLRQQIDSLTVPPPPSDDGPSKILGDPEQSSNAGNWQISMDTGQDPIIIRHQPLHSGSKGLDLPELSDEASDDAIHDAISRIKKAQATIEQRHTGFVSDANRAIAAIA